MVRTTETRGAQAQPDERRAACSVGNTGLSQRWITASPRVVAQRLQIARAFGPGVAQLKPPDDLSIVTYEDSDGLLWSRDSDDRWYRPGATPGEKIYWGEEAEEEAPQAVVLPTEPGAKSGSGDGYRQTWTAGTLNYLFSSGHGYRANHHKPGEEPSKDITALGSVNEIELAILRDITGPGGIPGVGESGTRLITVSGEAVEYRFKRFSGTQMGIGTYYRPD